MFLGEKIRLARIAVSDSQEKLAEKIGVSRQTIINWEKGRTIPDGESLVKLANCYQLSLDEWLELSVSRYENREKLNRFKIYGMIFIYLFSLILSDLKTALFLTLVFMFILFMLTAKEFIVTKH